MNRRKFINQASLVVIGASFVPMMNSCKSQNSKELFYLSLAEWSVNSLIFGGKIQSLGWDEFTRLLHNDFNALVHNAPLKHIDFPKFAREQGIDAVEYVNTCFFDKANSTKYLNELNKVCNGEGVKSLIIMCDEEGALGDSDKEKRNQAVQNHYKWIDAAAYLGCHSIRVNAQSAGSYKEQLERVAEGISNLATYAKRASVNVLIENHGGISSNGKWLTELVQEINQPEVGLLPDFGNFTLDYETGESYDAYLGIQEMMPYAKAVSAKSKMFDNKGNEIITDYYKVMELVLDAGYRGYVGIEFDGDQISPTAGIQATKRLLEKIREEYRTKYLN